MDDWGSRIAIVHLLSSIVNGFDLGGNDIRHHSHEGRVIVRAAGTDQFDPQAVGDGFCFDVQVIEHLDMVADKADGRDDDSLIAVRGQVTDRLPDIRFEPGIARAAAAALISERPLPVA